VGAELSEVHPRMGRAERRLPPKFPGLKGKGLAHAIRYGKAPKRRQEDEAQLTVT